MLFWENSVDMLNKLLLGKNFGMKLVFSGADDATVEVTSGLPDDFISGVAEIQIKYCVFISKEILPPLKHSKCDMNYESHNGFAG